MEIRKATPGDIEGIVDVHLSAFRKFFLTSLGRPFNRELYGNFVRQPGGVCLVAEEDGRAVGFAAGALEPGKFFSMLKRKRWHAFLFHYLRGAILHPALTFGRLLDAVRYRGDTPESIEGAALLSSFAVDPGHAGRGIGKALLREFCRAAREGGARHVFLTTDRDDNEAVNRFYRDFGFRLENTFVKYGYRHMNRYVMELSHSDEEPGGE